MFLFVGFLGSFTTFSTYTFDTFLLLKTDQFVAAFLNMGLQVLFGLALAIAGWYSIYALKISG
jgi:CrcB protein